MVGILSISARGIAAPLNSPTTFSQSPDVSTSTASKPAIFTSEQKQEIEKTVREYLINRPEVLIEASLAFQKKEEALQQQQIQVVIKKSSQRLFYDLASPVEGNPNGDVTLV